MSPAQLKATLTSVFAERAQPIKQLRLRIQ